MPRFEAETAGPPRRVLYLEQDRGWSFRVTEFDADGEERPLRETWADTFAEIKLYPRLYAPQHIVWRNTLTNEIVDIYALTL